MNTGSLIFLVVFSTVVVACLWAGIGGAYQTWPKVERREEFARTDFALWCLLAVIGAVLLVADFYIATWLF